MESASANGAGEIILAENGENASAAAADAALPRVLIPSRDLSKRHACRWPDPWRGLPTRQSVPRRASIPKPVVETGTAQRQPFFLRMVPRDPDPTSCQNPSVLLLKFVGEFQKLAGY